MSDESRVERRQIAEQYRDDPEGYERAIAAYDRQQQYRITQFNFEQGTGQESVTEGGNKAYQQSSELESRDYNPPPKTKQVAVEMLQSLTPQTRIALSNAALDLEREKMLTDKQKAILAKVPPDKREEFIQRLTQRLGKVIEAKRRLLEAASNLDEQA